MAYSQPARRHGPFDRRLKVFNDIEAAIIQIVRQGEASDDEWRQVARANAEARFLFGNEIDQYLQSIIEDVVFMNVYRTDVIQAATNSTELFQKRLDVMVTLPKFFTDGAEKFAPYIRLDQKNTPFWRPW